MDECCTLLGVSMCLFILFYYFFFEATNQGILPRGLVFQTTWVVCCMGLYTVQHSWCSLCCVGAPFLASMPCLFWYSFHCQCSRYISVHETKKKMVSTICKFLKLPNCVCFLRLSLCHLSCVVSFSVGIFFFFCTRLMCHYNEHWYIHLFASLFTSSCLLFPKEQVEWHLLSQIAGYLEHMFIVLTVL